MNDRIKLAEAMGYTRIVLGDDEAQAWFDLDRTVCTVTDNGLKQLPDPFTDANDEQAVFRFFVAKKFSERNKYFEALREIVRVNIAQLTEGGMDVDVAWPWIIMYLRRGDYARAALKVIE